MADTKHFTDFSSDLSYSKYARSVFPVRSRIWGGGSVWAGLLHRGIRTCSRCRGPRPRATVTDWHPCWGRPFRGPHRNQKWRLYQGQPGLVGAAVHGEAGPSPPPGLSVSRSKLHAVLLVPRDSHFSVRLAFMIPFCFLLVCFKPFSQSLKPISVKDYLKEMPQH